MFQVAESKKDTEANDPRLVCSTLGELSRPHISGRSTNLVASLSCPISSSIHILKNWNIRSVLDQNRSYYSIFEIEFPFSSTL